MSDKRLPLALRVCLLLPFLVFGLAKVPAAALELKELVLLPEQTDGATQYLLDVEIVSEERCMFGDLDAVLLDLTNRAGRSGLQLAVEPLLAAASAKSVFSGPHADETGRVQVLGRFPVKVPHYNQATVLGIFLCSADLESRHQQPCTQKQLEPINTILSRHQVDKSVAMSSDGKLQPAPLVDLRPPPAVNKVYFARFAIARGDLLSVPVSSMNEESYTQLSAFLRSQEADVTDYEALNMELSRYGNALGSMPIKIVDGRLQLVLPYYSTEKCLGRRQQ